ncbi:MAG TPA: hypothetical protein VIU46_03265 [Gallionellaceae bacterium]
MNTQRLSNNYHDAHLERVAIGPRPELVLFIRLDPAHNATILQDAVVRFGSIANFREVEAFFSTLPMDAASDHLGIIRRLEPEARGSWALALEGYGEVRVLSERCLERKR